MGGVIQEKKDVTSHTESMDFNKQIVVASNSPHLGDKMWAI
ncbi:hypothetical protein J2T13_000937 [Paenibacillus sp. DS2015]